MDLKHPARIAWTGLAAAWLFDFLFWNKAPGINFLFFITLCLAAGLALAWGEGLRPSRRSFILILPVLFFAAMVFIRQEPLTLFVSALLCLASLALLAYTLLGGRWMEYSLSDYVVGFFRLAGSALVRPGETWARRRRAREANPIPQSAARRQSLAVARGIFLAVPVVGLLAGLLASADPIFAQGLQGFFNLFRIERLGEYTFRTLYILILAYVLAGVLIHALTASREEPLIGLERPWLKPFLGWTETAILLGSVVLLFAVFVAIQARYFFGGQANIHLAGFTYAEYARRGFSELVTVAVITLLLALGLNSSARRETAGQRRVFLAMVTTLVALVLVILVSAAQRLILYESAYGFSRLRAYTHVFIPWLGVLLLAAAGLELARRPRLFALAALISALGFGASLSLLDIDGFIARQNIARAAQGFELDVSYLVSLSDDAIPVIAGQWDNPRLSPEVRDQIGAVLACRVAADEGVSSDLPWQSFNLPRAQAEKILSANQDRLAAYQAAQSESGWVVKVAGQDRNCFNYLRMD